MFCNFCGNEINEDTRFCPCCGRELHQNMTAPAQQHFNPMICAQELTDILPAMEALETNYNKMKMYEKAAEKAGGDIKKLFLGLAVGGGAIVASLVSKVFPNSNWLSIILALITIAGLLLASRKVVGQRTENERHAMEEKREEFRQKYEGYYETVLPVVEEYIPNNYRYSTAIASFASYFINWRADSIKEAINLYEEEMHRLRMENTAQLVLRETQRQTAIQAMQLFEMTSINFRMASS